MQRGPEELLSLAVHTAAHSGRWDRPTDPRAEKDRSSGLHRLLQTKRIEGKCDAPKHKHTCLFILFEPTTEGGAGLMSRASSWGVLSHTSWFLNKNVCRWKRLGGGGHVNIKVWAVKSARDYSARPVCGVDYSCDRFHVVWMVVIWVFCRPTCCVISAKVALLLNVHSSIVGSKSSSGHAPTDPEAFSVVQ